MYKDSMHDNHILVFSNVTLQGLSASIFSTYLPEELMLTAYSLQELTLELYCNHINTLT
jgi:hypothetical protein